MSKIENEWKPTKKDDERRAKMRGVESREEELLRYNGVLDEVLNHNNNQTCPLCGERYKTGDEVSKFYKIHNSCLKKLKPLPKAHRKATSE